MWECGLADMRLWMERLQALGARCTRRACEKKEVVGTDGQVLD